MNLFDPVHDASSVGDTPVAPPTVDSEDDL
jgi:hypothetical protein